MTTKTLWTLAQVSLLALSLGGIAQAADVKSIAVLTPEEPNDAARLLWRQSSGRLVEKEHQRVAGEGHDELDQFLVCMR